MSLSPSTPPAAHTDWPSADRMFAGAFRVDLARRLKYWLRLAATTQARRQLLAQALHSAPLQLLLDERPRALFPVMNQLLDRRLGTPARLAATVASVQRIEAALGTAATLDLLRGQTLELGLLPAGTRITFEVNAVSYHEGLWSLNLVAADGLRLYSVSFGFTEARRLLVGSVQGPTASTESAERIRQLTAEAEGLRPAYLLMQLLRCCAKAWGVERLDGIDPINHVKGRWNHRRSRLRFDYVAFWQEHEGQQQADGHWQMPLDVAQRPIEDVPSKRRAMYRRRYALMAALESSIAQLMHRPTVVHLDTPWHGPAPLQAPVPVAAPAQRRA